MLGSEKLGQSASIEVRGSGQGCPWRIEGPVTLFIHHVFAEPLLNARQDGQRGAQNKLVCSLAWDIMKCNI